MSNRRNLIALSLLSCAGFVCVVVILAYDYHLGRPRGGAARDYGELSNIDVMVLYRDSLPEDGRFFSWYAALSPPRVSVSFDITEEGFRKWVSSHDWNVSEVSGGDRQGIKFLLFENSDGKLLTVRPTDGLIYSRIVYKGELAKSAVYVAFDRSEQRAYFQYVSD